LDTHKKRQGAAERKITSVSRRPSLRLTTPARLKERRVAVNRQAVGSEIVMTLHEVASYLRCHESTVYRLTKRGELPAFRLGAEWRFLKSNVDKWIFSSHQDAVGIS
jgi:excisionase family DNA binding protein